MCQKIEIIKIQNSIEDGGVALKALIGCN